MQAIARLSQFVGKTFAIWVLLFAILAFFFPPQFRWIAPYIVPLLGIIMFGMGLTLTPPDFALIAKRPIPVVLGVIAQFVIMPLLGLLISMALGLPPARLEYARAGDDLEKFLADVALGGEVDTWDPRAERYDEVVEKANEHMVTLQVSHDITGASAEVALKALLDLQEEMLR